VSGPGATQTRGMRLLAALALLTQFWTWPIGSGRADSPTVLRPFEPGVHRWDRAHRGLDLVDPGGGFEVVAAGPGTVVFAGRVFGRGVVVISHGALRTSYEPVTAALAVGTAVTRGQPIGTLEPGHCPAAPCLHWGLLTGHGHTIRYYDPIILFGSGRVRLEPADTR
jgi:murein DD-endopeptidase MepM/ murein hydrolase activator NlpD